MSAIEAASTMPLDFLSWRCAAGNDGDSRTLVVAIWSATSLACDWTVFSFSSFE